MKTLLLIGLGSFFGGILRYLLSHYVQLKSLSVFPWGTLTVNIVGCFLIGCVFAVTECLSTGTEWRLFLATGFLGGFTTFSAFSNATFEMLRAGYVVQATGYVLLSVGIGLTATLLAYWILKTV